MDYNFSKIMDSIKPSEIRELLKFASMPGMISFGGGMPNPLSFPLDEIKKIADDVIVNNGKLALQYGNTGGLPELKDEIAKLLLRTENIKTEGKNVIVTTGSQQALYAMGKIFVNPGETVMTEAPTYIGAISAFVANGVRMRGVPMDENGMRTDILQDKLDKLKSENIKPRFIYVIPNYQNPAGYTMSTERRKHLLDIAQDYKIPLIEDNPYGELRYYGPKMESLKSMERENEVIYLGTFSKVMAPGLRVGYVNADEKVIQKVNLLKQGLELATSSLSEFIAYEYLKRGIMLKQVPKTVELYRGKRDLMIKALEKYFPEGSTWSKPNGGMFIWATVNENIDTTKMAKRALENKVAYVSGASFYPDDVKRNNMRLNFTFSTDSEIEEGVKRLSKVVEEEAREIAAS